LQFQCNFKISGYFWDPAQYEYKVNFLYNNILSPDLTSGYANKNEDQSVTLTINTLNGPCLNRYSKVVVFARPLEGDWDYAYKYFTAFYYSDINCSNGSQSVIGTNLTNNQIGTNVNIYFEHTGCNPCGIADGIHPCNKYKLTTTINKQTNQNVVIEPENCIGYSAASNNTQCMYADVTNNSTTATLNTYFYYLRDAQIWLPCDPSLAAIVYHVETQVPCVLSGFSPNPPNIFGEYGYIYAIILQGVPLPYEYIWHSDNLPNNVTFCNGTNLGTNWVTTTNYLCIHWPLTEKLKRIPQWKLSCQAHSSINYSNAISCYPGHSTNSGCPWLYVMKNDATFEADNNVLHKSTIGNNVGEFITDKYVLKVPPGVINDFITLNLMETGSDSTVIDEVKLYAVDHPNGTIVCVTENNQIAVFNDNSVLSTDNATKNGNSITDNIQYYAPAKAPVYGDTLDQIYVHYEDNPVNNLAIITEMENDWSQPISSNKNVDGFINVQSYFGDNYQVDLIKRQNKSITAIPLDFNTIEELNIDVYRKYHVSYISYTGLSYNNFSVAELPFYEAVQSASGDISEYLFQIDTLKTSLISSSSITLKFQNIPPDLTQDLIRDYVFQINGQTIVQGAKKLYRNNLSYITPKTNVPFKNKLENNYPNPFNPVTKINFSIAKKGLVTLKIYDLLGREIRTLVNDVKSPGPYSVDFNGSNLASGVYFYKLSCNGFSEVKKMVLIK
jgi:hypothetical protein